MPDSKPGVLFWYRIYCAGMAALYLVVIGLIAVVVTTGWWTQIFAPEELPDWFLTAYFAFIFFLCSSLATVYLISFFLKDQPWTWIYHLILISVGLTSPCTLPASIPLLLFWLKPETRRYFGRN